MRKSFFEIILIIGTIILSVILVWYYTGLSEKDRQLSIVPETEVAPPPVIRYLYEIPTDSFSIGGGVVKTNQMLSVILSKLGVPSAEINIIVERTKPLFDVRRFKAGNKYTTFSSTDSIQKLAYFVYEQDAANYLVIKTKDSIEVWTGVKQIDTVRNSFAGSIHSSLWNTFIENNTNPMMANELSEIYAWTIDFFGLQQGDSMRVVFDEYFVDSVSIGIGTIHGAWFRHMNKDFWAIPFMQDSLRSFFDDKGQSLRKAFLKAPLKFSRISSRFSNSRLHPILKIRRAHHGIDYAAPVGTPVYSIGDGVIIKTSSSGGAGNMVKVRHNSVYSTAYLHLRNYAKGIKQGVYVKQGDVIGYVGSTGLSTGPHLDFRFYKNGNPVDPLKVEAPSVDPVKEDNMPSFELRKTEVMELIGNF